MIQNYPKRHPNADRPMIDYETALILEPLTLAGTVIGVLLNSISPNWVIITLLVITLSFTAYKTGKKGIVLNRFKIVVYQRDPMHW